MLIHVTGASGSGTSTLAAALSERLGFAHLEADDYLWLPTEPPFTDKRDADARAGLLATAFHNQANTVLAGSVVGWGSEIEDAFDLIVFLYLDTAIRVERLRQRESARFGRVNLEFLRWAAQYDAGTAEGRSLARHRSWLLDRSCPVVELSGNLTVDQRLTTVLSHPAMSGMSGMS